ncbi:MAG: serine/threonine protein kinase [Ktedonobacteraceae bacterium]|nr:serine/threonine protein kinase [Ktedonobacteraceae bacterium]
MAHRVGQQVDNYRLLRLEGTGGFGEVYLAEHIRRTTQAPVAIKILHPHAQDELHHFLTEARIFRLKHPNIIQVLDFGIEGHTPFIVMEYAPNGTLRQRHPKGTRVPLDVVVSYVKQVASALQYAHDERLVHRDVKPENMLIGVQNQVLLSDFGIATITHGTSSQSVETMAGTILYMAPEQILGHPCLASDQYSLGVVVYEWLCGDRPFQGTLPEVIVKQATLPPPSLHEKAPTIPPEVEQVVMKALSKEPKQRFDSVQAFATALEQASQPVPSHPVPPSRPAIPRRMLSIVSGILLVLLIGTFFTSRLLPHPSGLLTLIGSSPTSTPSTTVSSPPMITTKDECINGGLPGVLLEGLSKPAGTVQIESGTDSFSALSPTAKMLTVQPGTYLNGKITLLLLNQLPSSDQAPLIGTPSWGDDSTDFWTISSWIGTGALSITPSITLTAPSQPGTYYLIFAFQAEIGADHVASATNWQRVEKDISGKDVWHDGNDIAEFTMSQIAQAQHFGCTTNKILMQGGYLLTYAPADAVTISVRPATK